MADDVKVRRDVYFHPAYGKIKAESSFYGSSYLGGNAYLDAPDTEGDKVLVKLDRESERHFKSRKALATVRNVCRPLVDRTSNYLFGEARADQIKRSDDASLAEWSKNVDLEGTTLHDFLRERYRAAQIDGWAWIGIDSPIDGEVVEEIDAEGEEDKADVDDDRPFPQYLVPINAGAVVDWEYEDGVLVRHVTLDVQTLKGRLDSQGETSAVLREWVLVNGLVKLRVVELNLEDGLTDEKAVAIVQEKPPESWKPEDGTEESGVLYLSQDELPAFEGVLPFVRVEFPGGVSQIAEVAHSQRRIVNLKSWEDAELSKTFSTVVISGASDEDVTQLQASHMNVICIENENAKIEVLGADADQAKSLREAREAEEKDVARGANLEASHRSIESKSPESGEKRKRDLESLYQVLAAMAGKAQDAERAMLRMLEALTNTTPGKWSDEVSYPTSFDVQSVEELILEILELQKIPYVPDEFLRSAVRAFIAKRASREPPKVLERLILGVDRALPPFGDDRSARAFFLRDAGLASRVDLYMDFFPVLEGLKAEKDEDGRLIWDRESEKHRKAVLEHLVSLKEEDEEIQPPPIEVDEDGVPIKGLGDDEGGD